MNVIAKLRNLPTAAKVALAVVFAAVSGLLGHLLLGDTVGGAFGIGAIFSAIGALFGKGPNAGMASVLREKADRLDADADRERDEEEARARLSAEARADDAREAARLAGADDGGDPRRVLGRHRDGGTG